MNQSLIFIVEDDADLRPSYIQVLKPIGQIIAFANAAKFLTHLQLHPGVKPDLVITDFAMPEMSGVQMVAEAQKMGAKFPVILISGQVDKEAAVEAVNRGFCMILEKPVRGAQLRDTVRHLLLTSEINKVRAEILSVVEQMREMQTAFREMCVNELGLTSIADPEALLDARGHDGSRSLNQTLKDIETRLTALKSAEEQMLQKLMPRGGTA